MYTNTVCTMKKQFLLLAIPIGLVLFLFTVLCLLAVGVGAQEILDDPITTGFVRSCSEEVRPCWNGIGIGATPMEQASNLLMSLGYQLGSVNDSLRYYYFYSNDLQPGCIKLGYGRDSNVVSYMRLYCMDRMDIGRFASRVGIPQAVLYRGSTTSGDTEYLTYIPNDSLKGILLVVGVGWHSVRSPISSIDLFSQVASIQSSTAYSPWHGFMPMWRYCRLEPTYPRCK